MDLKGIEAYRFTVTTVQPYYYTTVYCELRLNFRNDNFMEQQKCVKTKELLNIFTEDKETILQVISSLAEQSNIPSIV